MQSLRDFTGLAGLRGLEGGRVGQDAPAISKFKMSECRKWCGGGYSACRTRTMEVAVKDKAEPMSVGMATTLYIAIGSVTTGFPATGIRSDGRGNRASGPRPDR